MRPLELRLDGLEGLSNVHKRFEVSLQLLLRMSSNVAEVLSQAEASRTRHSELAVEFARVRGTGSQLASDLDQVKSELADVQSTSSRIATDLHQVKSELTDVRSTSSRIATDLHQVKSELTDFRGTDPHPPSDLHPSIESIRRAIAQLWERLDFVRKEALLEIRYDKQSNHKQYPRPRIVDVEKLELAKTNGLQLNLGCGHIPLEGYINVDKRDLPGIDIVADVGSIPIEKDSVCVIYSAHMLEHFPQESLTRQLLPYWFSLLVEGGEFRSIVPDGEAMLQGVAQGNYAFEDFREVLFGGQDYEGDFHYNLFTPASFATILRSAGFEDIHCEARGRRNGKCFEFEMVAKKPRR